MVNFGPLAAEIVSLVWGTPANFNRFRVLAALLHSQTAALNRRRHVWLRRIQHIRDASQYYVRPIPTDRVAWSVSLSVGLCQSVTLGRAKTAEAIDLPFGLRTPVAQGTMGSKSPIGKGQV